MNWQGKTFRDWFAAQERSLREQADLAGLLQHSSTVGTAREFLVKSVLKAVLPPIVHIGSGIIIDGHDKRSKQIDVILYDSRFPVLEFEPGVGVYPVEGVIATIEVKTQLSAKELRAALENCLSVLQLGLASPNFNVLRSRSEGLEKEKCVSTTEARYRTGCEVIPATYIFSFASKSSPSTLCGIVDDWYQKKNTPVLAIAQDEVLGPAALCPTLPRVVVSGNTIGVANDGWNQFVPSAEDSAAIQAQCGGTGRVMMAFWRTEWPFWWFATSILHTACNRLGMVHAASHLRYKVDHYLTSPESMERPQYLLGVLNR